MNDRYVVERSKDSDYEHFGWDVYRVEHDGTRSHVCWQILEDDANRVANGLVDGTLGEVNGYIVDRV